MVLCMYVTSYLFRPENNSDMRATTANIQTKNAKYASDKGMKTN